MNKNLAIRQQSTAENATRAQCFAFLTKILKASRDFVLAAYICPCCM